MQFPLLPALLIFKITISSVTNSVRKLKIHQENTKENHKRVGSVYVIKIHVPLYVKKFEFFGLRKINFETFFAN